MVKHNTDVQSLVNSSFSKLEELRTEDNPDGILAGIVLDGLESDEYEELQSKFDSYSEDNKD